ncbi:SPOR domain-containing protein [Thermomonas paludicola]|jgi:cell division septation protein DedD|uniref:SPOR domain-containing protein n=1 Tax=Thermomonas paludicola TaxID=2884874 RepID=UPI002114331F|nr:SPOR domain-containing protein [Thermomonas paludicola]
MLLRPAIVMLVMLNLGAAGWWAFHPQSLPVPAPDAGENAVPGLQLLTEAAPIHPPVAEQASLPVAVVAAPTVATAGLPVCLRFGPFVDAAAREVARAALAAAGVSASPYAAASKSARGWKVYLPALASHEEAQAQAAKLKAAGVSDLYVMSKGDEANSIALGRFSSEDAAQRRLAELRGKGVAAQLEPLGEPSAQQWLQARLPAGMEPAALAAIAPSQPLQCARPR